MSTRREQESQ